MSTDPAERELNAHEAHNQAAWDAYSDEYQAKHGAQLAESGGRAWGTGQLPETELRILGDVSGKDILEARVRRSAVVDRPAGARRGPWASISRSNSSTPDA